ncbi:hypothetical protein ACSUZJ_14010 [Telluria sp. B2]
MNRLLTTLLVWLLMAALPLHAAAASINMSCAPVPSPAPAVPVAGHAMHATHDDSHGEADAHHGGHAADAASDNDDTHAKAGKLKHSSCSACSAFCAGAVAPPSFSLPLPAFEGSEAILVTRADSVAGFIPDGLRRPPRR